jgi:TatD DNase family protein
MEFIDTHCHLSLSPLFENLTKTIENAHLMDIKHIIVPSIDVRSWKIIEKISTLHKIYPAFGLHPVSKDKLNIDELEKFIKKNSTIALGEIGLDNRFSTSIEKQVKTFELQLELARHLNLPAIVHCVGAFDFLLKTIKKFKNNRFLIHGFSKGAALARELLKSNCLLSIGGAITIPGARRIHEAVLQLPIGTFVLETDSPCMKIENIDASDTTPSNIINIAKTMAKIKNISIEEIALQTSYTAKNFFSI